MQPFEMIFDTGSNWLWVNSRICQNCNAKQPRFDERNSTTYSFYEPTLDLHYGSGDVYGLNSHDQVCITPGNCSANFSFLTVGYQVNLDTLETSGIVGMSPKSSGTLGDLFIIKMRDSGVIDKAVFSIMIELKNNKSMMTFGGVNLEEMSTFGSTLRYHPVSRDTSDWELTLQNMTLRINDTALSNLNFGQNKSIIIDSGTSFFMMPKADRDEFFEYLDNSTSMTCVSHSLILCYCTEA